VTQANDTSSVTVIADTVADDRSTGASRGEKLRDARERRSLSLEQVADALHLDEAIIVALEQGRFETLGAPVYVRGHLKAYARMLGLSVDEIVSKYQSNNPAPVAAPALRPPAIALATVNPVLWAGGAFAILLGLLLGFYVLLGADDLGDTVAIDDSVGAPVVEVPVRTASSEDDDVAVASEVPIPVARRTVAASETVIEPSVAVVEAEADDFVAVAPRTELPVPRPVAMMRLGLQFNQESWVEISDANRRLLFGLQREGYRREVTGEPPFNLLIGNARGVNLTINGEPFDVPAARVRGKVARFEITGEEFE